MTRLAACCCAVVALSVALLRCGGSTERCVSPPPAPPALVTADAAVPPSAPATTPETGGAVAAPDVLVKAGWIGATSTLFVAGTRAASRIDEVREDGSWRGRRCAYPEDAFFLGASEEGHVALVLGGNRPGGDSPPGEVALLDVRDCALRRTGIPTGALSGNELPEVPLVQPLSADGTRLVLNRDDELRPDVYALPGGKLLAHCETHSPAGGPSVIVGLSADGMGLVWRHGRDGTWLQRLATCTQPDRDEARSGDFGAMVSPHRRIIVACPYHQWGTETPVRGFWASPASGRGAGVRLVSDALADDDYDACSHWAAAISHDDGELAFVDAGRLHVVSLSTGRERMHTGAVVGRGDDLVRGLAFSPQDREVAVWESGPATRSAAAIARVTVVGLAQYQAYLRAPLATYEGAEAARAKAVRVVRLDPSAPTAPAGEVRPP